MLYIVTSGKYMITLAKLLAAGIIGLAVLHPTFTPRVDTCECKSKRSGTPSTTSHYWGQLPASPARAFLVGCLNSHRASVYGRRCWNRAEAWCFTAELSAGSSARSLTVYSQT